MGILRQTSRRLFAPTALAMTVALLAGAASADIIHYKDGRTVEGRILDRTATHITVDTEFGKLKIELSKIERIEEKTTPAEELEARRAEIAEGDAAGLFELALWARDASLDKDYRRLLHEVIELAPSHALANELLGRVKVDGVWMAPEEVAAYVAAHEAEKRAQGYLWHENRWRPEAEVMSARGFVRHEGAWVPRRQAETELALADLKTLVGLEFRAWTSKTITLYSALPDHEVDMLGPALEAQVQRFLETLEVDDKERERVLRYDIPIFLLPATSALARFVESGFIDRFVLTEDAKQEYVHVTNFNLAWPRPLIVLVQHGEHIDTAGDEDIGRLGILSHQLAHVLMQRFTGTRPTPGWVQAGMAALAEDVVNETTTLNISTWDWMAPGQGGGPWVNDWYHFGHWNENLRDERKQSTVPPLRTIMYQRISQFDSKEIGVSWSVVAFMLERHRTEFLMYLRAPTRTSRARRSGTRRRGTRASVRRSTRSSASGARGRWRDRRSTRSTPPGPTDQRWSRLPPDGGAGGGLGSRSTSRFSAASAAVCPVSGFVTSIATVRAMLFLST
jgi:hypothetical protein